MPSPTKLQLINKESSFLIRKTVRPPSAIRGTKPRDSSPKKVRDQRRSVCDYYNINRSIAPSSLGKQLPIQV